MDELERILRMLGLLTTSIASVTIIIKNLSEMEEAKQKRRPSQGKRRK